MTGRAEIWAAIRNACELIREGQIDNARGILEAVGVTLPTGSLVSGGYDEIGVLYRAPGWILAEPENLIETTDVEDSLGPGDTEKQDLLAQEKLNDDNNDNVTGLAASPRLREEKGKGKAVPDEDAVKVKCRLSDRGGPDVTIMLGKSQLISVLANRVQDEADVS